jgi:hypothetical protein
MLAHYGGRSSGLRDCVKEKLDSKSDSISARHAKKAEWLRVTPNLK